MKRVLIVDDTKNIRLILTKCLELEGYDVMTASDGKQALEMFAKHSFDLAFIDIKLPEVRGTEILKTIRELGNTTPVIIITAYATVKNAIDCTNMGAIAYVQKPFSAEKIKSVLRNLNNSQEVAEQKCENISDPIRDARVAIDNTNFDKSLEYCKKALSIDINNPEVYYLISKAYQGLGNKENAERFFQIYKSYTQ